MWLNVVVGCPPHDGARRRWWINVASAVSLIESSQKTTAPLTTGVPSTARAGSGLLPRSGNDLTLFFELRFIDLAAGEALGQDFQCG
jgi:hypothetical protein